MIKCMLIASCLMFSQFANAYTIAEYKSKIQEGGESKTYIEIYVSGFGQGLNWATSYSKINKNRPVFCAPAKLVINGNVIISIVDNGLKNTQMKDNDPLELFILTEMARVFPCS